MKNLDLNSGLWIVPSYFNHACASNTSQFFINDLQFIYAKNDIKQGEELTVKYTGMDMYKNRVEYLKKFEFESDCWRT